MTKPILIPGADLSKITYGYFTTVKDPNNAASLTFKLLEGQYAKEVEGKIEGEDAGVQDTVKIHADEEGWKTFITRRELTDPSKHPEGTVFKVSPFKISVSTAKVFVMETGEHPSGDKNKMEVVSLEDAKKEIEAIRQQVFGDIDEDEDEEEAEATEAVKAAAGSEEEEEEIENIEHWVKKYKRPTIGRDGFAISKDKWKQYLGALCSGENLLLTGDSGTGKTETAKLLADRLGLTLCKHDLGGMSDAASSLQGVHRLGKEGSEFDYSKFVGDIQKPSLILLDEINRAPEDISNILFPILDDSRSMSIALASSSIDREIKVHPDCIFLATANIGAEYTGTVELDPAFEERFELCETEYPTPKVESNLLMKRHGIGGSDAEKLVKVANIIRNKFHEEKISRNISIRTNLKLAKKVSIGFTLKEAWQMLLTPKFREEYAHVADAIQAG